MAKNQCDGCSMGLPVKGGIHRNQDGSYVICCTKHLYATVVEERLDREWAKECEEDRRQEENKNERI